MVKRKCRLGDWHTLQMWFITPSSPYISWIKTSSLVAVKYSPGVAFAVITVEHYPLLHAR
jgi:hypothetical protein